MSFDECVEQMRKSEPLAAKWVEALADEASTTDGDWYIFEAAGRMLANMEQSLVAIRGQSEQAAKTIERLTRGCTQ